MTVLHELPRNMYRFRSVCNRRPLKWAAGASDLQRSDEAIPGRRG